MSNKKGVIIINAYSSLSSSVNQASRLKEEFHNLGVEVDVKRNLEFSTMVKDGKLVSNFSSYDFCIYLDKDKYVSEILSNLGIRTFNKHEAIRVCDDKMRTYIALAGKGINVIDTIPGTLCYTEGAKVDENALNKIASELGFPMIIKENYGSLGQGVYKADNFSELKALSEKLKTKAHLFQKMITNSVGRDIRVIVIGKKVFASMERVSKTDFRSNIELGATGKEFKLPPSFRQVAEKVAEVLDLDYCGIDILIDKGNVPIVCEVNSNAFFGGIESVTNKNVAKAYAEYVLKNI